MNKVEHLVYFRFKKEVTQHQQKVLVQMLYSLFGKIDGLQEISAGINTTEETHYMHDYSVGMRMLFRSRDALREYQVHPEHLLVSEYIHKIMEDVAVMDFEINAQ